MIHPYRNLVVVGPPGVGKSFLGGQFMWTLGGIDNRTIEKYKTEAQQRGCASEHGFVYFFDRTFPERKVGHTIQPQCPYFLATGKVRYGIMCPSGNLRYMKSFCKAVGKADLLLLLVSATDFKKDTELVIQNQLKICHSLSLAVQIVVGITKCDLVTDKNELDYTIKEITATLSKMIEPYFSLSGFFYTDVNGSNYVTKSTHLQSPNTLLELIDNIPAERYKNELSFSPQSQFLCPVDFSFKIKGVGDVVCGKVISGHLDISNRKRFKVFREQRNDILPFTMENQHFTIHSTEPYLYIGLNLAGGITVKPGMILSETPCEPTSWITTNIKAATSFTIRNGATFNFHTSIGKSLCKVDRISADPNIYKDSHLQEGGTATVQFKLLKPIYLFPYDKVPNLGSFVIAHGSKLFATGIINFAGNLNSFESFYELWPKFHTYLQPACSNSILGFLSVLKRLQAQGKIDMPYESTRKVMQTIIAHWFLQQPKSNH